MNKRILSIFVAVMALMFALTRCDKSETDNSNVVEERGVVLMKVPDISEEELVEAITFVGQGKTVNYLGLKTVGEKLQALGVTGEGTVLRIIKGRPKKGCSGFGICRLCTPFNPCVGCEPFSVNIVEDIEDNSLYFDINRINFNNFTLELAEPSKLNMEILNSVKLPVEENLDVYDNEGNVYARIYAGEYLYKPTIGKFGGFELKSEYVKY